MFPNNRFEFRLQRNVDAAQSNLAEFVEQKHREIAMLYANIWLTRHPDLAAERFTDPLGKLTLRTPEHVKERHIEERLANRVFHPFYVVEIYDEEADNQYSYEFKSADEALRFCDETSRHILWIRAYTAGEAKKDARFFLSNNILDPL